MRLLVSSTRAQNGACFFGVVLRENNLLDLPYFAQSGEDIGSKKALTRSRLFPSAFSFISSNALITFVDTEAPVNS